MENNMQSESEVRSPAPNTRGIGNILYMTGWIAFWVQLGLAVVSGLALLFATTGRSFINQASPAIGIGIFWAVCGVVILLLNVFWDFRYTRIGKSLENPNPSLHPSKADTIKIIRLGLFLGLVGLILTIIGAQVTVAVLVAKSLSQPPGMAITDSNNIIRPLDVFVALANVNGIAAHFVGTIASLWLLERVHQH